MVSCVSLCYAIRMIRDSFIYVFYCVLFYSVVWCIVFLLLYRFMRYPFEFVYRLILCDYSYCLISLLLFFIFTWAYLFSYSVHCCGFNVWYCCCVLLVLNAFHFVLLYVCVCFFTFLCGAFNHS